MRAAMTLEQCWHAVPGGVARAAIEQAAALDRLARDGVIDLELVGVAARHADPAPAAWTPPIAVEHLALPRPLLYETWHRVRWPGVERATGPVDVVHGTAVAVPASRAPLVMTIHDLAFLDDPSVAMTSRVLRYFRRATELARRRASLVLCPSEATLDECRAAGFDDDRLRLVPWGVRAFDIDDATRSRVRAQHGLHDRSVLFCGTVEPRKNLRRLVEAFAHLGRDDVELVLVGPEGWREDLGALTKGARVRSIGFVEEVDLRALFELATVVAYPSVREGFGLPVLEAMAQGAAVVTSATTATAEVGGDAAVLVDPLDVDAIARGIEAVLDDEALAQRLGTAARERALTYTWEQTAKLTYEAYQEAAR